MSNSANRSAEVATIDGILNAMYEVISGQAGEQRDWDRFRSLYADNARLMPVVAVKGEAARVRVLSPEDYIRRVEPIFATENFYERETSRQTETFGRIAHVLSRYESLRSPTGEAFEHGVNSIQLFSDDSRWWIVSVLWNTNRTE